MNFTFTTGFISLLLLQASCMFVVGKTRDMVTKYYVEESPPSPPFYPPRWTILAHFTFTNASNKSPAGAGILYQIVDSINEKFRADDIFFGGTFAVPYDTLFASSSTDNQYMYYASVTENGISCVVYPGIPTTLTQNWVADLCAYNATLFYGSTKAYRWNCVTDTVTWFTDTAAEDGRPIYQYTLPQPFFDVYQDLWFTNYTIVDKDFDPSIFLPPKGWNCPKYVTS